MYKDNYKELLENFNNLLRKNNLIFDEVPIEWNWYQIEDSDHESIKRKKKLMSGVKNQYLCGCCWAISCATAISDAFVISEIVDWSPDLSYTYALAKYSQNKCIGGNSYQLLEDIMKGEGITSESCVDSKWCLNDKICSLTTEDFLYNSSNNKKIKEVNKIINLEKDDNDDITKIRNYISNLIPSEGCYDGEKLHYVYNIDSVYNISIENSYTIDFIHDLIKKHILLRGPVIGVFPVPYDFLDGKFSMDEKNNGIFLENIDKNQILGTHSVVVVGWGKKGKIPYWICKNSWGKEWGDKGFFKIAMYPYNKIAQFTKKINIIANGIYIKEIGGVSGFKVSQFPSLKKIQAIRPLLKNQNDKDEQEEITLLDSSKNSFLIFVIIIIFFIFFIVFKPTSNVL